MGQIMKTKFGDMEFEQTWTQYGGLHIGRLTQGGYAHISGLPVTTREELASVIPPSPELDKALKWFDDREQAGEEAGPKTSITMHPDGSLTFADGTAVTELAQIMENIPPGPLQEAAVKSWAKLDEERKARAESPDAKKMKAVAEKELKKPKGK